MSINTHGDPTLCMVVGCGKKALYRNAQSARTKGTQRGYCSAHKALAIEAPDFLEEHYDRFESWLERSHR